MMQVICIDDGGLIDKSIKFPLIIGKLYDVMGKYGEVQYLIINELGQKKYYSIHNFAKIGSVQWRDMQIDKLLKKR